VNNIFLTLALSGVALLSLTTGSRADVDMTLIGTGQDVQVFYADQPASSNDVLSNAITSGTLGAANSPGDSIDLGTVAPGQAIILNLENTLTGQTFTSSPADANPDGLAHAEFLPLDVNADPAVLDQELSAIKALSQSAGLTRAQSVVVINLASDNSPDFVVGFWDNTTQSPFIGGSLYVVTGADVGAVPEPGSVFCFSVGLAGLAGAGLLRRRAA
jgi:MYXO-CTERM domain-containing protein